MHARDGWRMEKLLNKSSDNHLSCAHQEATVPLPNAASGRLNQEALAEVQTINVAAGVSCHGALCHARHHAAAAQDSSSDVPAMTLAAAYCCSKWLLLQFVGSEMITSSQRVRRWFRGLPSSSKDFPRL
ncbi:hypothetical protein ACH5RR_001179 [Cinchona calisaya]|uniref:Uncharacterized protein n=1 Tax=Cinchona calisaya TaxID=153742 RepID=A0ABD3B3G3_9GENT